MKRLLYLLLIPFLMMSCKDDYDISRLQDSSRLVVYSFPTESDTTLIFVCKSVPVSTAKGYLDTLSCQTVDAHVIYKVNGVECLVKKIESTKEARLLTDAKNEDAQQQLVGHYYAVGKQKSGDHINIEVEADGCSPVSASTYIPKRVEAKIDDTQNVTESEVGGGYSMDRLLFSFEDDGSAKDYYAVKVNKMKKVGTAVCIYHSKSSGGEVADTFYVYSYNEYLCMEPEKRLDGKWNFDSISTVKSSVMLDTDKEPALNKSSKINEDLGFFDDYQYYDEMYCFDDHLFNGKKYTLHLGVFSGYSWANGYYATSDWDQLFGYTYFVELYKLTPEYYRYLSSINSAQNNSWAEAGIMQVTPTYSNVKGGLGVVAGYNASIDSRYIEPPKNQDESIRNR